MRMKVGGMDMRCWWSTWFNIPTSHFLGRTSLLAFNTTCLESRRTRSVGSIACSCRAPVTGAGAPEAAAPLAVAFGPMGVCLSRTFKTDPLGVAFAVADDERPAAFWWACLLGIHCLKFFWWWISKWRWYCWWGAYWDSFGCSSSLVLGAGGMAGGGCEEGTLVTPGRFAAAGPPASKSDLAAVRFSTAPWAFGKEQTCEVCCTGLSFGGGWAEGTSFGFCDVFFRLGVQPGLAARTAVGEKWSGYFGPKTRVPFGGPTGSGTFLSALYLHSLSICTGSWSARSRSLSRNTFNFFCNNGCKNTRSHQF